MGNTVVAPYACEPLAEDTHELRLSVYALPLIGLIGGYHSAVVVRSRRSADGTTEQAYEYAFGGSNDATASGVYSSRAERDPAYAGRLYRRVVVGAVRGPLADLEHAVALEAARWPANGYNLLERNCNHFASTLLWRLIRVRPPMWINRICEGNAAAKRRRSGSHPSGGGRSVRRPLASLLRHRARWRRGRG